MKILPSRYFLYSGLQIPFFVEFRIDGSRLTLRTWKLSFDAHLENVASLNDFADKINAHAAPFIINNDPLGLINSGRDIWFPVEAIPGVHQCGARKRNIFLQPISQMGFMIAPDLLGNGAWADYGVWSFTVSQGGYLKLPFNRFVQTRDSKMHARLSLASQLLPILLIYVPFANETFERCSFVLQYNRDVGCVHNMKGVSELPLSKPDWESKSVQQQFGVKGLLPSLQLEGPETITPGGSITCGIHLVDPETESLITDAPVKLYLESDAGYLPRRQVMTENGVAECNLMAFGLSAGMQIKLKAGWRNYSGAVEKIIAVV